MDIKNEFIIPIQKIGKQTLFFENSPYITGFSAFVGKKEKEGPIGDYFEFFDDDPYLNNDTFEKAESQLMKNSISNTLSQAKMSHLDIDFIFAGDLLNQCIGSSFAIRENKIPFMGLYGACSTMAESLIISSVFIASGAAKTVLSATSSHFCSAERQFRLPLEYGGQRPPTAQWTVTGSGSIIVEKEDRTKSGIKIIHATIGKIEDLGIKDVNNMGAAMAPAAASTLSAYFSDTKSQPDDYDLIITGDLGTVGSDLLYDLLKKDNFDIKKNHVDCGKLIFDSNKQDVHAGGSGCGCCGSVLTAYFLPKMKNNELTNILFMATGALMSPTTVFQKETIPSIAHLLHIIKK